eukprot:9503919-Pyramimonas_sp.AAC.3
MDRSIQVINSVTGPRFTISVIIPLASQAPTREGSPLFLVGGMRRDASVFLGIVARNHTPGGSARADAR